MSNTSFKFDTKSIKQLLKNRGLENGGRVQKFIDNEVIRLCEPYANGPLRDSAELHTDIGSGEVIYSTPYARKQYYQNPGPGSKKSEPLRGKYWFERMKADHGEEILEGARKIAGAK